MARQTAQSMARLVDGGKTKSDRSPDVYDVASLDERVAAA